MPIELSNETERLVYTYMDSKIFYKRIGKLRMNYLEKIHTRRGVTDWNAVSDDVLRESVLGWENIITKDKKQVSFDPDLIMQLPLVVHNDLIELIGGDGSYQGEKSPEKNLPTSSSGK